MGTDEVAWEVERWQLIRKMMAGRWINPEDGMN